MFVRICKAGHDVTLFDSRVGMWSSERLAKCRVVMVVSGDWRVRVSWFIFYSPF